MPDTRKLLRFLLALTALIAPFCCLVRFSVAGIPFSITELLIYFTVVIYILAIFLHKDSIAWRVNRHYLVIVWGAVLLLTLFQTLALPPEVIFEGEIYSPLKTALGIWKGWLVAPFLYFLLIIQLCPARKNKALIKRGFLIGATLLALYSIVLGDWSSDGRLLGIFSNPNYLSLYLAPALWITIEELLAYKKSYLNLYEKAAYFVIISLAILLTRSYGAVMALALISVLRIIFMIKDWKRWVILGIVILAIGGFVAKEYSSEKFAQSFEIEERSSLSVRTQIWEVALDESIKQPLSGIGLGQFQLVYWQNAWDNLGKEPYEWNILHAHNVYLHWMTETGIVGLGLFVLFVILVLWHNPFDGGVDLRLALGVILAHGMVDLPFWKQDFAFEFMLICALIVAGNYRLIDTVKIGDKETKNYATVPSVNLEEKLFRHYEDGMYLAYVYWRGQRFPAVGYIGQDSIHKKSRRTDFHLFGLQTDLYGEELEIEVIEKLRDRRDDYKDKEEFKKQLAKDLKKAKQYFNIND